MFIGEAHEIEPEYEEEYVNVHVWYCAQVVSLHRMHASYLHIYGYEDKKYAMS